MKDYVLKTREIIRAVLKNYRHPVIAMSFGKDSVVMFDLVCEEAGRNLPVFFFREPHSPWKYEWADTMIRDLGLTVYSWPPFATGVLQGEKGVEIQNYYSTGGKGFIACPTGIVPPKEGRPFLCGFSDILNKPTHDGVYNFPWDCIFIGHRGDDTDPTYGEVGTRIDARVLPNQPTMVFPLRGWTHDDIWEYTEERGLPINHARYEKKDGKWGNKEDFTYNSDYFEACTACLDAKGPKFVQCPKLGIVIENISDKVARGDTRKPSYMKDE